MTNFKREVRTKETVKNVNLLLNYALILIELKENTH